MAERQLPFVVLWKCAVRDSTASPLARLAAHTIGTYMDKRGECFPSRETIAAGMGLKRSSTKTVDARVRELVELRLLLVARSKGGRAYGGRGASSTYTATIPTVAGEPPLTYQLWLATFSTVVVGPANRGQGTTRKSLEGLTESRTARQPTKKERDKAAREAREALEQFTKKTGMRTPELRDTDHIEDRSAA